MFTPATPQPVGSARPEMTAAIIAETGLDDQILTNLVHGFYGKAQCDPVLGPIFAERITDWGPHLERMVAFWSSVALMTGRYHGRPVPAHTPLPIEAAHFERWLALFRATAQEVCTPAGAAHVILRAERIARSLHIAVQDAQTAPDAVPAGLATGPSYVLPRATAAIGAKAACPGRHIPRDDAARAPLPNRCGRGQDPRS